MRYIKYLFYNAAVILLVLSCQSAFAQYSVDSCDEYPSGTCTCYDSGFDYSCVYSPDNEYYGDPVGYDFYPNVYGNFYYHRNNNSFHGQEHGFHGGGNFMHGGGGRWHR